jgi:ABC-type anion transport system duplicated permease subunit
VPAVQLLTAFPANLLFPVVVSTMYVLFVTMGASASAPKLRYAGENLSVRA